MNPSQNDAIFKYIELIARMLLFIFLVYLFLVAVKLFGSAADVYRNNNPDLINTLAAQLKNPFTGLCLGIILTALIQSSSATTSMAVAMVATGVIPLENAISIVMGANIGSSSTSTIAAITHMGKDKRTFTRAYSAAVISDVFNILTVLVCFPLEMCFGFLSKTTTFLASLIPVSAGSASMGFNPISYAIKKPVGVIQNVCERGLNLSPTSTSVMMTIIGLALLIVSLIYITKNMKILMADRIEAWLNRALSKNGYIGLLVGIIVTMIIQSSGISTSLLVPLVAAGVLSLSTIYPIVLGANIGTTLTAILAALAFLDTPTGYLGLALAFAHTLFNLTGVLLFYPIPQMRFPVFLTERLSQILSRSRWYIVGWIVLLFFILPGIGFLLYRN